MGTRLAEKFDYTGIEADASAAAVAASRIASRGAVLIQGDAAAVAPRGPFDVICAFEVLEHIEDDAGALADWRSRLRPGGQIILSVPAHQGRFGPADVLVGHYRRYPPEGLERLLIRQGFESVDVVMYGFPLGYALEAVRNRLAERSGASAKQSRRRPASQTARSGRWLQPSGVTGLLTWLTTLPFRYLQRPFSRTRLGTGLVATARRPVE